MLCNNVDVRRCSYFQLGLPVDVLKQRSSSLASRSSRLPLRSDCKLINIDGQNTPFDLNKRYIWNSKTRIVKRPKQQRYRRFNRRNTSLSTVVPTVASPFIGSRARSEGTMRHGLYEIFPFALSIICYLKIFLFCFREWIASLD